jgi:hypothetical protein
MIYQAEFTDFKVIMTTIVRKPAAFKGTRPVLCDGAGPIEGCLVPHKNKGYLILRTTISKTTFLESPEYSWNLLITYHANLFKTYKSIINEAK